MRSLRWGLALVAVLTIVAATISGVAVAFPVSTNGLVVSSATLEVRSVGDPTTWVPVTTVYEGSPARLVLAVESPGSGVVRTTVTLPGVTQAVGDASSDVSRGAATVTVPLDLSYGAWLAGAVPNTADHLDVSVTYTATSPGPASPATTVTASPTPTPTPTPTLSTPTDKYSEPASPVPASSVISRPVKLVTTGAPNADRRAIRAVFRALPSNVTVVATIRPTANRPVDCPTARSLVDMVNSLSRSSGRPVVILRGEPVRQGCPRLEFTSYSGPRTRSVAAFSATTFTVPIVVAPRPVILVHGMWSSASMWTDYTRTGNFLVSANPQWRGYAVSTMDTGSPFTPYAAVNTISQNAALAWTYLQGTMTALNAHEVDVVGHSMGGIITRRMLHDPTNGPAAQSAIRSVVLMGTPNGGSSCSTAWAVPANAELTYAAIETFNLAYPQYPGTFTTSLYSDHYDSTCFDANAGDLFVPSWSTQAQAVNVVRRIDPGIQHADMPGSSRLFSEYVKPALALAAAPAAAGPTVVLTNPAATSTVLDQGTATGASLSVTRSVTIASGRSLVASVVAPADATGTLTYPTGSGTATVALSQVGDYPIFEHAVGYATLGGTSGPLSVSVTINATTAAASPEWRWSLVSR
jgi:pimeloyl-ACP methyl ester carboxylesterase